MLALSVHFNGSVEPRPTFTAHAQIHDGGCNEEKIRLEEWAKALAHPRALRQLHAAVAKASHEIGVALPPLAETSDKEIAEEVQTLNRERRGFANSLELQSDRLRESGSLRLTEAELRQIETLAASLRRPLAQP